MKIISIGNNFGHSEGMELNTFLSDNVIVLNGRFTVDTTSEEYRLAGLKGAYIAEGRIEDGILTVTNPSASMGDTGENQFLFAFIVRDAANANASGTASMDKDTEEESTENLDNR